MVNGGQTLPPIRRHWVLAAMVMGIFTTAIEATVVATAIPSIVGDLGGFQWFSWLFSIFMLSQAATVPLYGKLADLYGRKPVFTAGMILFLLGTALCGSAATMQALIAYRGLQGLGAGAVMPIALTVVADIFDPTERARIQGYISSVFGISAILGPALGGFIVTHWTWPWIFYINIPIGCLSLAMMWAFHREPLRQGRPRLDLPGAILLVIGVSGLIILLSSTNSAGISGGKRTLLWLVTIISLLAFIRWERRAPEPLVPLALMSRPLLAAANSGGLLAGILIIGLTSIIPTVVQGVMEQSPTIAGFSLTAMSIGWPVASSLAGFIMLRIGYRQTARLGSLFAVSGTLVLASVTAAASPFRVAAGAALTGAGLGLTTTTYLISIQSSVDYSDRGIVTASHAFARQLGQSVGAALLGGFLTHRLIVYLSEHQVPGAATFGVDAMNRLLDPEGLDNLTPALAQILRAGLEAAARETFLVVAVVAGVTFIIASLLPPYGPKSQPNSDVPSAKSFVSTGGHTNGTRR